MTNSRRSIIAGILLVATAAGTIVAAFFVPPAAPAIVVGGMALASVVAGEVVKVAVSNMLGRCARGQNSTQDSDSDGTDYYTPDSSLEASPPARPNTPDIDLMDGVESRGSTPSVTYHYRRARVSETTTDGLTVEMDTSYHSERLTLN